MALKDYEFWLIVGSQHLYGEETLRQVKEHAQIMTEEMNRSGRLPCSLVLKPFCWSLSAIAHTPLTMPLQTAVWKRRPATLWLASGLHWS